MLDPIIDEQVCHIEESPGICTLPPANESVTSEREYGIKDGFTETNC